MEKGNRLRGTFAGGAEGVCLLSLVETMTPLGERDEGRAESGRGAVLTEASAAGLAGEDSGAKGAEIRDRVGAPAGPMEVRAERFLDGGRQLGRLRVPRAKSLRRHRELRLVEYPAPCLLLSFDLADLDEVAQLPLRPAEVAGRLAECQLHGNSGRIVTTVGVVVMTMTNTSARTARS